jgi:hypothetical protein
MANQSQHETAYERVCLCSVILAQYKPPTASSVSLPLCILALEVHYFTLYIITAVAVRLRAFYRLS